MKLCCTYVLTYSAKNPDEAELDEALQNVVRMLSVENVAAQI